MPQFDQDKKATHTPPAATKKITLSYVDGKWIAPSIDTAYPHVNFTVRCGTKPAAPNHDELSKLIGDITINCTSGSATHTPKSEGDALIDGSYTTSGVEGDATSGYTYTVTIKSEKHVNQFDTDTGSAHTPKDGEATVVLEYKDKAWAVKRGAPVSFNVACVTEIVPPEKPVPADLGSFIKVICTTKKDVHGTAIYPLHEDRYAIGEVEGNAKDGYTCTITIEAAGYVATYSNAKGEEHTLVHENDASKTVTLTWDSEAKDWSRPDDVTFEVKCETEIVPPTAPTLEQLPDISVTLHCGTTSAHRDPAWSPLLENTYEISAPTLKNDVYTCTLTIKAEKYVGEYSGTVYRVGKHELDDDATKDIVLTWDGQKWTAEKNSVTFKVKCSLYTVIYTDGVKGEEVFADVVYKDIPYGTSTPAFGTKDPTREGYKFVGWEPEVAETVTKDVTYTAKWEKLYTVTYTDGVKGKAFKDQVYSDLEAGTDTPKFDGKPTRKGYTFTGWSPKVTDTVTKDVTYVAQWKSVKNGKDNIPKTGDSEIVMVLGSVLLFSFCGAAAVSVYDRKRKHF